MPTLLERRREAYEAAQARSTETLAALDDVADDADLDALTAAADEAAAELERTRAALDQAEALERARAAHPVPEVRTPDVRVTDDRAELTYRHGDPSRSFFSDMYRARFMSDPEAQQRLQRNAQEQHVILRERGTQYRDVATSAFGGLIPPVYLTDMYAPLMRAGRPFAEAVRRLPLPSTGMSIVIPRGTTGAATAIQASENAAIQETDPAVTDLTIPVRTIAGQVDASRQSLERGEGVDEIIFADLAADYAVKLDAGLLSGAGTSGTHLGILNTSGIITVAYTDASPTVPEIWPKIQDAAQQIAAGRYLAATALVMHPRRWAWFQAALDTANRPLFPSNGPMNAMGTPGAAVPGAVGQLAGFPVIVDASLPTNLGVGTNQDPILLVRLDDILLWEEGDGVPRQMRFEEPLINTLTVRLVVYGYSAFSAGRYPLATAVINGTGTVPPTF
ncbi:MAG TPA: phage major capsid protein [Miltoncostaeaceae bacterium]|nr:phage major capsid protein [Miltoncostaeaceae bacterium]